MALDTKKSITRFDAVDEVRYVVFRLGTEKFGARIEHLKEVLLIKDITAVPRAQEFVLGVINLRGVVCTIVDLGSRLNVRREEGEVEKLAAAETRSAIIVEIGKNILGMAVDHVESITSIPVDIVESNLDMIKKEIHAPFLAGVAKMEGGEIIILLDIGVIFSEYEVSELADLGEKKTEDRGSLQEELALSQEEMQRLDLAYDDIDEIAAKVKEPAKAPREVKSPMKPAVADVAPLEKEETVTPVISKDELEDLSVKPERPEEPVIDEKDPATKEKPAKPLFTKEKSKEGVVKPERPEEPAIDEKDPATKEKPAKGKKLSKSKPSESKKPSKAEKESSKTAEMPIISPNLSRKELEKLSRKDLIKMAEDRDIPKAKKKKKKELVKLLAETFKQE